MGASVNSPQKRPPKVTEIWGFGGLFLTGEIFLGGVRVLLVVGCFGVFNCFCVFDLVCFFTIEEIILYEKYTKGK